ncbi:hypothetical protein N0V90_007868 [Kalmusia sp. IMI 367209]|nr:hypothetical protein N0V90_007868 [Kalmusia sp. IMI 367209]
MAQDTFPTHAKLLTAEEFANYFENHEIIPSYDPSKEQKLSHPFWTLDSASIDTVLKEMYAQIDGLLIDVPQNDRELHTLLKSVHEIAQIKPGPPIKIGLFGPQGCGKSMLINALFGFKISWSAADGGACTSAVIKYAHYSTSKKSSNSAPFYAEVKFLDEEKIEEMIREHTRNYAHYQDHDNDSDEEEPRGTQSFDQDEADRRLGDTAEDVFRSLFGTKEEFLACWSASPKKEFIRICRLKCREVIRKHRKGDEFFAVFDAQTPDELLSYLRPFLASNVEETEGLWPLVDHVTVFFDHELLRQGAIIIDLPGSGDINVSRARHAEELRNTVDILFVLADTLRIKDEHQVINTMRDCMKSRGTDKVRLVATKIDALLDDDLASCSGELYDRIRKLIKEARIAVTKATRQKDSKQKSQSENYKVYLERYLLEQFARERKTRISHYLSEKLYGRTAIDVPQIFHVSAANQLEWLEGPDILFCDQPPLSPQLTGVPSIRKYIFNLLAPRKFRDVVEHINIFLPRYIGKIERVMELSDRDADFETITKDLIGMIDGLIKDLLSQAKCLFQKIFKDTFGKARHDTTVYKRQVDSKFRKELLLLRGQILNIVLKYRGTVHPGASKAKGLEKGYPFNKELSNILDPMFQKWAVAYVDCMKYMKPALLQFTGLIHRAVMQTLDNSSANIMVVERAKRKWSTHRRILLAKMEELMDQFERDHERSMLWATMEDNRQKCLVATITDSHYENVFASSPAERPSSKPNKKRYVMPRVKYQRELLEKLFLDPSNHFVDITLKHFQDEYGSILNLLLEKHFNNIRHVLEQYGAVLQAEAPIPYKVESRGITIRADFQRDLASIEQHLKNLKELVPEALYTEDDNATSVLDIDESSERSLVTIYNNISRKRKNDAGARKEKIKREKLG